MATQTLNRPNQTVDEKIQLLRQLYADSPVGKAALENSISTLRVQLAGGLRYESAGRVGLRQGKVSELTVIAPLAPGGAARLRALLQLRNGNFDDTDRVGTVHNMRFVFLDNDTKLMLATAYDGDWDVYIEDFVAKIPNEMDVLFSCWEGWPGIHNPKVKDFIANHQITAAGWYVAHPDLTVRDVQRVKRVGKAAEEFLDKVGS